MLRPAKYDLRPIMSRCQFGGEIDLAVLCAFGQLGINVGEPGRPLKERGQWSYLDVPPAAIASDLPGVVARIEAEVHRLGGPISPG